MESTRYQRLSAGDKDEQELDNSEQDYIPTARWSDRTKINLLILSNLSLVFTLSALCFLLWRPNWFAPRNAELRAISFYSPLFDRLDIPTTTVLQDNTLFAHSEYAKPPSKEVDELWTNLTNLRMLLVDSDTIRRIGKDPEVTVQHPQMPGKHLAILTMHHQLHCLNSIRKNIWRDHFYPNGSYSKIDMDHLLHCVDLLRSTLQCNANLDIITYNWVELMNNPQPDFKVNMKCRDHSAIEKFLAEPLSQSGAFRLDQEGFLEGWIRQGGEKEVAADKGWWEDALRKGLVSSEDFSARWNVTL